LRLAQGADREQQVTFFNLLVSLLKLSATPPLSGFTGAGSQSIMVAAGAVDMLPKLHDRVSTAGATVTSNSAASSSSSSCVAKAASSSHNAAAGPLLPAVGS
jgi:hypothetical protein